MEIHVYIDDENNSQPKVEIKNFWRELDKKDPQIVSDISSRIMCETMKELVKHITPRAVSGKKRDKADAIWMQTREMLLEYYDRNKDEDELSGNLINEFWLMENERWNELIVSDFELDEVELLQLAEEHDCLCEVRENNEGEFDFLLGFSDCPDRTFLVGRVSGNEEDLKLKIAAAKASSFVHELKRRARSESKAEKVENYPRPFNLYYDELIEKIAEKKKHSGND